METAMLKAREKTEANPDHDYFARRVPQGKGSKACPGGTAPRSGASLRELEPSRELDRDVLFSDRSGIEPTTAGRFLEHRRVCFPGPRIRSRQPDIGEPIPPEVGRARVAGPLFLVRRSGHADAKFRA